MTRDSAFMHDECEDAAPEPATKRARVAACDRKPAADDFSGLFPTQRLLPRWLVKSDVALPFPVSPAAQQGRRLALSSPRGDALSAYVASGGRVYCHTARAARMQCFSASPSHSRRAIRSCPGRRRRPRSAARRASSSPTRCRHARRLSVLRRSAERSFAPCRAA